MNGRITVKDVATGLFNEFREQLFSSREAYQIGCEAAVLRSTAAASHNLVKRTERERRASPLWTPLHRREEN